MVPSCTAEGISRTSGRRRKKITKPSTGRQWGASSEAGFDPRRIGRSRVAMAFFRHSAQRTRSSCSVTHSRQKYRKQTGQREAAREIRDWRSAVGSSAVSKLDGRWRARALMTPQIKISPAKPSVQIRSDPAVRSARNRRVGHDHRLIGSSRSQAKRYIDGNQRSLPAPLAISKTSAA